MTVIHVIRALFPAAYCLDGICEKARAILDELITRGNRVAIFRDKELTHLQSLIVRIGDRLHFSPDMIHNPLAVHGTTSGNDGPEEISQSGPSTTLQSEAVGNETAPETSNSGMMTVDNELTFNFDLSDELFDSMTNQILLDEGLFPSEFSYEWTERSHTNPA